MPYWIAVWEGPQPENDQVAGEECLRLNQHWNDHRDEPPSEAINAYVADLLAIWPDLGQDGGEDSPWSAAPLLGQAAGRYMFFPMIWSTCWFVSAVAARLAELRGLVCYDGQLPGLRPTQIEPPRCRERSKRRGHCLGGA